ncbi:MAG: hypothetical protein KF799_03605 [Bdellovibrionales bacterium]|nr:hypothetical protein [Bdellovibrionales bacterium]
MSMDFETLIQQPESLRDAAWEGRFLDAILNMKVEVVGDEPQPGPDGWPYLKVRTAPEAGEPFARVVKWLAGRGIGLVVNAHKMVPDYVFTYGMLWNYMETGRFVMPHGPQPAGEVVLEPGQNLVMGAPTPKFLPEYAREVLRQFLADQGFKHPRILVITTPDYKSTDLAFSVESLGSLPPAQQKVMAEALSWFLPLHYNLVLLPEQNLPKFFPL